MQKLLKDKTIITYVKAVTNLWVLKKKRKLLEIVYHLKPENKIA